MEVVVDKEANIAHQEGFVPRNNSPASYRFTDYLFKATGKQLYSMYSTPSTLYWYLTLVAHSKAMERMVDLLKETNALQVPILQIQRRVENMFQSIEGSSFHRNFPILANMDRQKTFKDIGLAI